MRRRSDHNPPGLEGGYHVCFRWNFAADADFAFPAVARFCAGPPADRRGQGAGKCVPDLQDQMNTLEATPGPQGPPGPDGKPGPAGVLGLENQACPSGQFLTGFDANDALICSTF